MFSEHGGGGAVHNPFVMLIAVTYLAVPTVKAVAQPITVFTHNYANIDKSVLERAEIEAERILETAGVEVNWARCDDSPADLEGCRREPGATELVLHLVPAGATRRNAEPGALGFALPPETGPFGSYAGVLCDRVEQLDPALIGRSVLLGHAIAHELGHLLLGGGGHAPNGIMKAEWRRQELCMAMHRTLVFRSADRLHIEQNVRERLIAAAHEATGRGR